MSMNSAAAKKELILMLSISILLSLLDAAEKDTEQKQPHDVVVAFQFPSIVVAPDDRVSVDFVVKNRGSTDEIITFQIIDKPEDWVAEIKRYGTVINGIFVPSGESQTLTFDARLKDRSAKRLPVGRFMFSVRSTWGGERSQLSTLELIVKSAEDSGARIELDTSYPVLRGSASDSFEFSLDVRNQSDEDSVFNFRATTPKGWEVSFKPAYEYKQITSLQIASRSSKTINVEVKPPYGVEAGEYPITVTVESQKAKAEKELKVVITGKYEIDATTPLGLLSYVAERGKPTSITLLVRNTGSAEQREITFMPLAPENWKVEFNPERLENLPPKETKQVEVKITPAREALIGDYSVVLQVNGEKTNDKVELRITVKAPVIWGWIGVGLIAVVIIGLAITFKTLGRR